MGIFDLFKPKEDSFGTWKADSWKAPTQNSTNDWRSGGDPFRHQEWADGGSWRHGGSWNNKTFEKKRLF